jgi:hypothetical protein
MNGSIYPPFAGVDTVFLLFLSSHKKVVLSPEKNGRRNGERERETKRERERKRERETKRERERESEKEIV